MNSFFSSDIAVETNQLIAGTKSNVEYRMEDPLSRAAITESNAGIVIPQSEVADSTEPEGELTEGSAEADLYPLDLPEIAYPGLIGAIVNEAYNFGSTDRAGTALQCLTMLGNLLERKLYTGWGATRDYASLFSLILGKSASGKGTALNMVRLLGKKICPGDFEHGETFAISSGEALVRLASIEDSKLNRILWWISEIGQLLNSAGREGNTLLDHGRNAFDGNTLQRTVVNKAQCMKADNYHLSINGHITPGELGERIENKDLYSGWWNRFIWSATSTAGERPKTVIRGEPYFDLIAVRLRALLDLPFTGRVELSKDGEAAFEEFALKMGKLRDSDSEVLQDGTARSEAKCRRLALIFAVFDEGRLSNPEGPFEIEARHVQSAAAYIVRSRETVAWFLVHGRAKTASESKKAEILSVRRLVNLHGGKLTRGDFQKKFSHWTSDKRELIATEANLRFHKEPAGPKGGKPIGYWGFN